MTRASHAVVVCLESLQAYLEEIGFRAIEKFLENGSFRGVPQNGNGETTVHSRLVESCEAGIEKRVSAGESYGAPHVLRFTEPAEVVEDAKGSLEGDLALTEGNLKEILPLARLLQGKADVFHFNRLSRCGDGG